MTRTAHRQFSQAMTWLLVVSMTGTAEQASLGADTQNATPTGWQELRTAAPGTKVELTLTSGAKLRGRLTGVEADAVQLNTNEVRSGRFAPAANTSLSDTQTFRRGDVTVVKVDRLRSQPSYRSSGGTPDAAST